MDVVSDEVLDRFVDACHEVDRRRLVRCSCGNLSMRIDAERALVTATGSWLGRLSREQVVVCRIADGAVLAGGKPSSETGFHLGILRTRPEVNAVLHFQTPSATAVACRPPEAVDFSVIPEIPYYIGPVARVPYLLPGSSELAQAVIDAMRQHDMLLMTNHGQVTAAHDFDQVIQNAEFFELACEILLRGGSAVTPMSASDQEQLRVLRAKTTRRAV
jgi:ribulose-5-phosphate 4-epimerase/fuculose-1-phosphate aldolase